MASLGLEGSCGGSGCAGGDWLWESKIQRLRPPFDARGFLHFLGKTNMILSFCMNDEALRPKIIENGGASI